MAKHNPGDWWKLLPKGRGQELTDVVSQITPVARVQNLLGWKAVHYVTADDPAQEGLHREALEQIIDLSGSKEVFVSTEERHLLWGELLNRLPEGYFEPESFFSEVR